MAKRLLILIVLLCAPIFPGGQGKTTVATPGTPVQICASCSPPRTGICTITALAANVSTVWLGFTSAVSAANKQGTPLTAGQSYACNPGGNAAIWSLNAMWLDASSALDGVSYSWN